MKREIIGEKDLHLISIYLIVAIYKISFMIFLPVFIFLREYTHDQRVFDLFSQL